MSEQRGTPVTLKEMTRRRDGWRQRWQQTDRDLMAARARVRLLTKQIMGTEYQAAQDAAEIQRLRAELAASRAEARRFAEECGRLRDMLVTQRVVDG